MSVQPLAYGYFRVRPWTSAHAIETRRQDMVEFAQREGLALAEVFAESPESGICAISAVIETLQKSKAQALIIPALHHLGHFPGTQTAMRELIERGTGVRLLVMYPHPDEPT